MTDIRVLRAARLNATIATLPASHRTTFEIEAVDALNDPISFDNLIRRMRAVKVRS